MKKGHTLMCFLPRLLQQSLGTVRVHFIIDFVIPRLCLNATEGKQRSALKVRSGIT